MKELTRAFMLDWGGKGKCLYGERVYLVKSSSPHLSASDKFQDLKWMPETADSNEFYIYYVFFLYTL